MEIVQNNIIIMLIQLEINVYQIVHNMEEFIILLKAIYV